ncbi:right-handed parallel beta-helix repeat-containing protein, partial [Candidatus Sumerlaeota bacterium]|nr:right-handed parallel beta-helix repeat-containing protein [Candidatus Sumerlaeota bacterium]
THAVRVALATTPLLVITPLLAGDLDPPGSPMSTPGPEPRVAVNADNTPGDSDSKFRITSPGSYYLTDNIRLGVAWNAIEIGASNVTLDLNGFTLGRSSFIQQPPLSGIVADSGVENVAVRSGTVVGFTQVGVDLSNARNTLVDQIIVSSSGDDGIWTGENSVVTRCVAEDNGGAGIHAGGGGIVDQSIASGNDDDGMSTGASGVVTRCVAEGNGGTGIHAGEGSALESCTSMSNTEDGIHVGSGSTIRGCVASRNTFNGFHAGTGSTVVGCTAFDNEQSGISTGGSTVVQCTARENTSHGIFAGAGCLILNNTCSNNGVGTGDGAGICVTGTPLSRVEGNSVSGNDQGIEVEAGDCIIIRNIASGNTTDYDLNAANPRGPIIDVSAGGDITSTNPWANFSF